MLRKILGVFSAAMLFAAPAMAVTAAKKPAGR